LFVAAEVIVRPVQEYLGIPVPVMVALRLLGPDAPDEAG
jgi:hypothetical protein